MELAEFGKTGGAFTCGGGNGAGTEGRESASISSSEISTKLDSCKGLDSAAGAVFKVAGMAAAF